MTVISLILISVIPSAALAGILLSKANGCMESVLAMNNTKRATKKVEYAANRARKYATMCFVFAAIKSVAMFSITSIILNILFGFLPMLLSSSIYVTAGLAIKKRITTFVNSDASRLKQEVKDDIAEKRALKKEDAADKRAAKQEKVDNAIAKFKAMDESNKMAHKRERSDAKFDRKMALEDRKLDRDDYRFDRKMDRSDKKFDRRMDRGDKKFDSRMQRSDRKFDRKMDMKDKRAELVGNVTQAAIAEHSADKQFKRDMRYLDAKEKVVRDMEAIDVKEGRLSENEAQRRHLGRQLGVIEMQQAHAVKDPEAFKEACARAGVDTEGKDLGEVASTIIKFAPTAYLERLPEDMPDDEKAMRIMQGAI